jgi:hypothetical protein
MENHRSRESRRTARSGSVLIEFAFIALAFYLLFAGTIELGRMITTAQAVQNAARVAAREMALIALPPTATFREALADPQVRARIYDEHLLAVQTSTVPDTDDWPVVNRMLTPLMILESVGGTDFYHYPGAVVSDGGGGFTVRVPKVLDESSDGTTIEWHMVVEEVVPSTGEGPFSLASTGPERGLVALRINCPYQATTMAAFKHVSGGQAPVLASGGVTAVNEPGGALMGSNSDIGPYSGPEGLGHLYVLDQQVRPFRKFIAGQSIFRREVYR